MLESFSMLLDFAGPTDQ